MVWWIIWCKNGKKYFLKSKKEWRRYVVIQFSKSITIYSDPHLNTPFLKIVKILIFADFLSPKSSFVTFQPFQYWLSFQFQIIFFQNKIFQKWSVYIWVTAHFSCLSTFLGLLKKGLSWSVDNNPKRGLKAICLWYCQWHC